MSNLTININKTTGKIQVKHDEKDLTEEMTEKISGLCTALLTDNSKFEKEKIFDEILDYISTYDRILYAPISNTIYACYNDHDIEEGRRLIGTLNSNIIAVVNYSQGELIANKINTSKDEKKKKLTDTKKAILKIWDHINLAQQQYSALKQTDEEYRTKFDESIAPIKENIERDINSQLITLVGIFTALAFLIFGGISSLDNAFSHSELPLLKLMITGSIWGLCILNLIFVFLFCIGKMTNLNFTSTEDKDATIFQKYPIVWWCNFLVISIMFMSMWGYYITQKNIHTWFDTLCLNSPIWATIIGSGLILVVITITAYKLIKATKYTNGHDKKRVN